MTANQLETLLCKPVWDYRDVELFTGVSSKSAYEIIEDLRGPDPKHKKSGWVDAFPKGVRRDAVLEKYATDAKTEMGIAIIARLSTNFLRALASMEGGNDGGV